MADTMELARAYITIVPSMEGSRQTITEELGGAADEAGSAAGSRAGSAFSGALGAAARVGAAAVSAAATGVAALTTQAVNAYSDYEQLTGGIETLYGDASAQMMQYAAEAATSTGQSMNEFMESAISTSAAMIAAVEGDQARAAELTNQSMIDMADNANKLGTDMEAIQNAYRGFSRGNFTMLDNLALGYAGTREGMQQLLADAQAISGVEYNIDSYADIVEAIHTVQEEMGIAGTTSREASETIQGSIGALGASWQNLITGIADPNADLGALIDEVIANAETALMNIMPVIERALTGIGEALVAIAPIIASRLPELISNLLPPLLTAAMSIVQGLAEGLISCLPALAPVAADMIVQFALFVVESLPSLVTSAIEIILAVVRGITDALPQLIPAAVSAVTQICEALTEPNTLVQLLEASLQLMLALADGLIAAIPDLLAALPEILSNLVESLLQWGPILVDTAMSWGSDLISGLVDGILGGISYVEDAVGSVAQSIRDFIGFSEPERGPLSNFHTFMPDMYDLLEEGIEEGAPEFNATLNRSLSMPGLMSPDISDGYVSAYANGDSGNWIFPVYVGGENMGTAILTAQQRETYRRGG